MKVVVSTCDEYAWIIPVFLHFLRKSWPDNPYEIEIITEKKPIAGKVFYAKGASWSARIINYLKQCGEDKILLIVEDNISCKLVNTEIVQRAEELCEGDVGCVSLKAPPRYYENHSIDSKVKGFREYPLGEKYSISMQATIWQKRYLLDVLREGETIWNFERKGSVRLKKLKGKWRILWADSPAFKFYAGTLMREGRLVTSVVKEMLAELIGK